MYGLAYFDFLVRHIIHIHHDFHYLLHLSYSEFSLRSIIFFFFSLNFEAGRPLLLSKQLSKQFTMLLLPNQQYQSLQISMRWQS